ncbi:MAG: hypothetical protein ABI347_02700 [Nitrososphaera sp.]|jgi:hypothetical protein
MRPAFVILLLLSSLLLLAFPAAYGQAGETGDPQTLTAGVYLINMGKIDLQTGSYDLDFYFWLSTADPAVDFTKQKPSFDFMNSMNARVEPSRAEPNYYEVRVKGTFLKNMDFRNYPFDTQQVTVEVEGFETTDRLVFVPDTASSGYDSLINLPGWSLGQTKSSVIVHQYPDQTYSRYIFSFDIQRSPLSSFLKTIFPVVIITTIAMLAFWMSPTNFAPRIGLAASTLLAAVAAHLNAANQLPPIGYLTLMDKVMIVAYALFLNNLISMVVQMRLVDHKKEEQAAKVNAKMRKLMPIIIGIILAVLVPFDLRAV